MQANMNEVYNEFLSFDVRPKRWNVFVDINLGSYTVPSYLKQICLFVFVVLLDLEIRFTKLRKAL